MLPLIVVFTISVIVCAYFINEFLTNVSREKALNIAKEFEAEVLLIESDVLSYQSDFAYTTSNNSDSMLTVAKRNILYNRYFTAVDIQDSLTGGTHKVLSYIINRDISLTYFLTMEDTHITVKRLDGQMIISEPMIDDSGSSYSYYSERLEWFITVNSHKSPFLLWLIIIFFLIGLLTLILCVFVFITKTNETIKAPITLLSEVTREIGLGNYTYNLPPIELTEFYHIAESFSIMAEQVNNREKELHGYRVELEKMVDERTMELQETVERLEDAQEQLVESERMASLGLLVSGISHEINTPLGIVLTGMSYMEDELKRLQTQVDSKSLTAKSLSKFITDSMENISLTNRNSIKVSNLIKNFKMVARDQESDDIRNFLIGEYIELIITNITGQYSYKGVDIKLNLSEDFYVTIYPGALYKVMYNLLLNSFQYGFHEGDSGTISITVVRSGDEVQVIYKDSGVGMSREVLEKVFEPFYTTNRVAGNTGLGMFIVYNQITQTLKGNIISLCRENDGTEYHLSFPIDLKKS